MVLKSIEKSLKLLKQEKINYIYLHSIDFKFVKDSAIDEIINLKRFWITKKIGVSCDRNAFQDFCELGIFDGFMMILNLVDQANYENLLGACKAGSDITLKRALANGLFSNKIKTRLVRYRRIYIGEILGNEFQSYDFRSRIMGSLYDQQLNYSNYIRYCFSVGYQFNANILIGTKSIEHLKSLTKVKNI